MFATLLLTLLASIILLAVSGRYAIRFLSHVASAFGISEFTVAFIILAVATSMPELFIAVSSSLHNNSDLILAVVFGSNIANVTLIVGLTALLSGGISTSQLNLRRNIIIGVGITIMPLVFLLNGVISRLEGVLLVGVFCIYVVQLVRDRSSFSRERAGRQLSYGLISIVLALIMIAVLIFASDRTVSSAIELAALAGIPAFLIGLFVLSLGSSLPEFVTILHSNRNGKPGMVLGNIIGSNISNSSLIIGIAAIIRPISTGMHVSLIVSMVFVVLSILLLSYLASQRRDLSIFDGLKLVLLFAVFFISILVAGAFDIMPL
jgi:cation:H+ antiporter